MNVFQKSKSDIVCEYITNCIESMRLILYKHFNLNNDKDIDLNTNKIFSIGLAVLKSVKSSDLRSNLLIKRYTLQIETLNLVESAEDSDDPDLNLNEPGKNDNDLDEDLDQTELLVTKRQECQFRDSLLKCLYSQNAQYIANFKWQIQLRTGTKEMQDISREEDLFKLFAWRQCDSEEITSVTTKKRDSMGMNQISVKPIKTIETFDKNAIIRIQLFLEQPVIVKQNMIKSTQQLTKNKNFQRISRETNRSGKSS